jgi:hypothetical protein
MPAANTTPAAERMRRHRERRREGLRCLWVELHETELDGLVRAGLLEPKSRHDENAIAGALYAHLVCLRLVAAVRRSSFP